MEASAKRMVFGSPFCRVVVAQLLLPSTLNHLKEASEQISLIKLLMLLKSDIHLATFGQFHAMADSIATAVIQTIHECGLTLFSFKISQLILFLT